MKQTERVLQYMKDFGSITQAQAFTDLGVYRLAARIADLRAEGYPIRSTLMTGKNRYGEPTCFAEYRLEKY